MRKFLGIEHKEKERHIEPLVNMGFSRDQAIHALKECDHNPALAVNYLLSK
jgi:Holliday junction resolvasome RuvABC DNA-binding subunit